VFNGGNGVFGAVVGCGVGLGVFDEKAKKNKQDSVN